MEKWKIKGKRSTKLESVLPPTRRLPSPTCLPMDKKKDSKWSIGGLLRRISSGQNNDVSSNDEDITYIPGHMLSKKKIKKTSKMKSKLGKISDRLPNDQNSQQNVKAYSANKDTLELMRSLQANVDRSRDSLAPCDDFVNSRSSEGSLDASGKGSSRIDRVKARAQAKRDRLCGNSSSDDDSHKSSQSSMRFRSEDHMENIQRNDPSTRRTRGARTERYIKRMYRDDVTSGSDSKIMKPVPLPRSSDPRNSRYSSNSVDSNIWGANDKPRFFSQRGGGSSPSVVASRCVSHGERNLPPERKDNLVMRYLRDMNENETFEREKRTWPHASSRRSAPINDIYGSLRSRRNVARSSQQRLLPPEPPPRSSKSRIFPNVCSNTQHSSIDTRPVGSRQSCRQFSSQCETTKTRSYDSDNEVFSSDYATPARLRFFSQNSHTAEDQPEIPATDYDQDFCCKYDNCNSLDRTRRPFSGNSAVRRNEEYRGERENYDPRPYFENAIPPPNNFGRSTCSLPKGVQLFSKQKSAHCGEIEAAFGVSEAPASAKTPEDQIIPKLREPRESCQIPSTKAMESDEAERKRSSKNLEEALSELEAIYNSLRLSDDDLLERAEQRSMEEYRDKAAKSAAEYSLKSCSDTSSNEKEDHLRDNGPASSRQESDLRMKDDMAYRRMNPKDRPSSVNGQSSLSNISYLATSPNLSGRETDCFDNRPRSRRGTPDLTRDDLLYRSISHANNTLKVIEPQPPFGIPLGPVTTATESDYLHVKPSKFVQPRSLYIPKSEPDVVSDDLAFRNLRKDPTKDSYSAHDNKNTDLLVQTGSLILPRFVWKNSFAYGTMKKRAVRSLSADLYGVTSNETDWRNNDWYSDYIRSTQKLRFIPNNGDASRSVNEESSSENMNVKNIVSKSLGTDESSETHRSANNNSGLDINGNRPKNALQRKIQVYVPQGTSIDEAMAKQRLSENYTIFYGKQRDSIKPIGTGSEDSSPDRCNSRRPSINDNAQSPRDDGDRPIVSFTEKELSEYKQLCQDLEKLIQRTVDQEEDTEAAAVIEHSEEHNSQSEFDELEKLLIDDYELPVDMESFDETLEATSTEREDDRSSSRSAGLGTESLSSDNIQSSPTKTGCKFADDDASSTSELGNGSSNTASSLTVSVYNKFNQLFREDNDVSLVQPTSTLEKYPADELTTTSQTLYGNNELKADNSFIGSSGSVVDGNSRNFVEEESGLNAEEQTRGAVAGAIDPSVNLYEEELATYRDDSFSKPILRVTNEGKRESGSIDGDEKSSNREGEKIEDERDCNDEVYYACKETTTTAMHPIRKLCHVTNRITAYHIVLCSLFLTLLITIIVAQ